MSATLAPDDVRPVEQRAEVECLGDLQKRRRDLLVNLAPLKALHGHNGIWDNKRKALLEAMKVKARMRLNEAGQKATDPTVEALAYADEQYAAFVDDGIAARIDYITLQNEYDELQERIESRQTELLVYNSEVKLAR
jgi:hypothetical protein